MKLARRIDTGSTVARRVVVNTTPHVAQQTAAVSVSTAGSGQPAISRVRLTCTGRDVVAPVSVNTVVAVTRSLGSVPVCPDSSENIASTVPIRLSVCDVY